VNQRLGKLVVQMVVKVIKHQNIRNGLRPFPFQEVCALLFQDEAMCV
jgi:hypothetical protein